MTPLLLFAALSGPDTLLGTMTVDVVSLIDKSVEAKGDASIFSVRDGYRYQFSSIENKAKFDSSHRYEVQLGGGCGKMGSLSGKGSTDRFAVHGGKVYLFASDGCRTGFLQDPESRIERDDPKPWVEPAEAANGKILFNQMVEWLGGREALLSVAVYKEAYVGTYKQGDQTLNHEQRNVYAFPAAISQFDTWDKDVFTIVSDGKSGHFGMPSGKREPFFGAQARELERIRDHKLLPAVINALGRSAIYADRGNGVLDIYRAGSGVRIWIGQPNGQVLAVQSRSRGPGGAYGSLKQNFTSFQIVKGVKVPVSWDATFNGEPEESARVSNLQVEIERVNKHVH